MKTGSRIFEAVSVKQIVLSLATSLASLGRYLFPNAPSRACLRVCMALSAVRRRISIAPAPWNLLSVLAVPPLNSIGRTHGMISSI